MYRFRDKKRSGLALIDSATVRPTKREIVALLRLAVPVVTVQLGLMFMGVVDTLMVGRVSPEAIAAVAMGNLYFYGVSIFGVGLLMALDPIVAQAVGAGDEVAIGRAVQRGIVLATALGLVTMLLLLTAEPVLRALRQPEDVIPLAGLYVRIEAPAQIPFYLFVVLRQTLQARHRMTAIVVSIVAANVVNLALNWVFIFGHAGVRPMGVAGSALATMVARWLMTGLLLALAWRELRPYLAPWRREVLDWAALRRVVAIGAPIGIQMNLEYGVFAVAGLLMGWLGTVEMAGHQVALNLASLTFMVPLGVSAAAAVLVGNAIGGGDMPGARRAASAAVITGVTFMALSAIMMLAIPGALARIYTDVPAVVAVAATLIPIAGVFQVFDGLQVVCIGILRGAADTRAPMLINILGFWLIGLPVSWLLGLGARMGPVGLWWGLTIGLVIVSLILAVRVRSRMARDIARVMIDEPGQAVT